MTASIDAAPPAARSAIILRYYLAMAMPFVVDVVTLCAYAAVNQEPEILLPSFLLIGVVGSAYFLIRPIRRFIARYIAFAEAERCLSHLPRRSATVVAIFYLPMITLR